MSLPQEIVVQIIEEAKPKEISYLKLKKIQYIIPSDNNNFLRYLGNYLREWNNEFNQRIPNYFEFYPFDFNLYYGNIRVIERFIGGIIDLMYKVNGNNLRRVGIMKSNLEDGELLFSVGYSGKEFEELLGSGVIVNEMMLYGRDSLVFHYSINSLYLRYNFCSLRLHY